MFNDRENPRKRDILVSIKKFQRRRFHDSDSEGTSNRVMRD